MSDAADKPVNHERRLWITGIGSLFLGGVVAGFGQHIADSMWGVGVKVLELGSNSAPDSRVAVAPQSERKPDTGAAPGYDPGTTTKGLEKGAK